MCSVISLLCFDFSFFFVGYVVISFFVLLVFTFCFFLNRVLLLLLLYIAVKAVLMLFGIVDFRYIYSSAVWLLVSVC